jgi:epoxide hydrolase-like predicted phosphatase
MADNVEAIIFDFGGVLINISYHLTTMALNCLSLREGEVHFSQKEQMDFFNAFEKGELTPEQFRKELRMILNNPACDAVLDRAWNAMLLDLPRDRIEFVQQLKQKKRTFLLSNTNRIHQLAFETIIDQTVGYRVFEQAFDKIYYSHEIGVRKPDSESFLYVLEKNNLNASKTLFIDDSEQNIVGAKAVGLQIIFLGAPQTIHDLKLESL